MPPARPETDATPGPRRHEGAVREMAGYNLKRAYIVLHSAAQEAAAEFDLRIPTFSCLSVIVRNPEITPSKLAEMLRIERSNTVVIVDELETRELVSRKRMKTDRRRYALSATVRGRHLHDQAAEAIAQAEATCLTRLSDDEQALLVEMLNRIEGSMTG
ncbi:MarR family winged helix-turn-helix transcriptional regulator [Salipiger mucosus]|uniref:Transcriptional regulator, MarR family n=1 Tax=Salipiger mucosus DSM 16094 TaxID=1123237 RepID=S9S5J3_9RHOB|nr:MarR family transcriptional regulator [Salipiger mucosus]EPX85460.1 Transcriptional regulator, MarR family [Salipiger mucosus DSM 16094]